MIHYNYYIVTIKLSSAQRPSHNVFQCQNTSCRLLISWLNRDDSQMTRQVQNMRARPTLLFIPFCASPPIARFCTSAFTASSCSWLFGSSCLPLILQSSFPLYRYSYVVDCSTFTDCQAAKANKINLRIRENFFIKIEKIYLHF